MQYDDTDKGAAFAPLEGQTFILQGKIDNAGEARPHAFIKDRNREGDDIIVVYKRVGVLYVNDDANDENKKPHYSGLIDTDRRISAWRQQKGDNKYLSIKISDKQASAQSGGGNTAPAPAAVDVDDSIPF